MPITGLTDRQPSFKEIARLRLGIPKSEAEASGPKEISYFRPDFRPDAQDAAVDFSKIYGMQPTLINIRLPFSEIIRCWDAYYEVYNKSGMLGMADGTRWLYLRHNQTGELIVKDGVPQKPTGFLDENGMSYLPFDKATPVYSYKSKQGQDVPVFAKPTGKLKVLIPELKRAAYVLVITHSVYNIMKISEQLAGIDMIARNAGLSLPMVPMILSRRQETISVSYNGRKSMQPHYLLNIEIDPAWMEAQFKYLDTILPGALPVMRPQILLPQTLTEEDLSENEPEAEAEPSGFFMDENPAPEQVDEDLGYAQFYEKRHEQPDQPYQVQQPELPIAPPPAVKETNGKDAIYQAVVDAGLSENIHRAKNSLTHYCKTGYDTPEKALAWFRLYRGWRDLDHTPQEAGAKANAGEVPQ